MSTYVRYGGIVPDRPAWPSDPNPMRGPAVSVLVLPRLRRLMSMSIATGAITAACAASCVPAEAAESFRPIADAHVGKHGSAGASRVLRVGRGRRLAYLRFAPTGITTPITGATLRVFKRSRGPARITARAVRGTWVERLVERAHPRLTARLGSSRARKGRGWVSIDITRAVGGNGVVDLS